MLPRSPVVSLLACAAPATPCLAQEASSDGESRGGWADREQLTGDWGGLRRELDELGASIWLTLTSDTSRPFSGGEERRTTTRSLFDATVELDLERMAGLAGTTAAVQFLSGAGRNSSVDVGDIQAFSNVSEDNFAQLNAFWIEHTDPEGRFRVKAGKIDANDEFAAAEAGVEFIHSSAGFSPTIFVFPTYPDPAMSVNLFAHPADGWRVGLAVYNAEDGGTVSARRGLTADFDETFVVGELDRTWSDWGGWGEGRIAVGGWRHSGELDRFDGGSESGSEGAFALFEQRLTREQPDDDQGLVGFLQWGVADEEVSEFEQHLGAGFLYTGLWPGRDEWRSGLYLSHVDLSSEPGAGLGSSELAVELFQEIVVTPAIVLKPDLQVIVDPSGSDDIDDAWVATIRVELSF